MSDISRVALFGKLNTIGYKAERIVPESVELGQADPGDFSVDAVLEAEKEAHSPNS